MTLKEYQQKWWHIFDTEQNLNDRYLKHKQLEEEYHKGEGNDETI